MSKPLSPAAQAVWDAYVNAPCGRSRKARVGAALRAVVDQAVPQPPRNWDLISVVSARECEMRKCVFDIATELQTR